MDQLSWQEQRRRELTENSATFRAGLVQLKNALRAEDGGKSGPRFLQSAGATAKEAMIDIIVEDLTAVAMAENEFLVNRQKLSGFVYRMVRYGVLLPPDLMPVRLEDRPGVSGELHDHVETIIELDERLKKLTSVEPAAIQDDVTNVCHFGYWSARLGARIFNALRRDLHDRPHDPADEWFASFVSASAALEEARYRATLGLALDKNLGVDEEDSANGAPNDGRWTIPLADGGWVDLAACERFVEQVSNGTAKPRTRWLHRPAPEAALLAERVVDEKTTSI